MRAILSEEDMLEFKKNGYKPFLQLNNGFLTVMSLIDNNYFNKHLSNAKVDFKVITSEVKEFDQTIYVIEMEITITQERISVPCRLYFNPGEKLDQENLEKILCQDVIPVLGFDCQTLRLSWYNSVPRTDYQRYIQMAKKLKDITWRSQGALFFQMAKEKLLKKHMTEVLKQKKPHIRVVLIK